MLEDTPLILEDKRGIPILYVISKCKWCGAKFENSAGDNEYCLRHRIWWSKILSYFDIAAKNNRVKK